MTETRVQFFWNPRKVGFHGHDDNGVQWSTSGPGNRPVRLSQYQRCGICQKPIHSGYRSEHGALVCPAHVDMVKVSGYELRAYHLKDGRRETWTYPSFWHARKGYQRQVALAEEAAAQVTFSLMVLHEDGGETCLYVY
jgi:hypothetical protein